MNILQILPELNVGGVETGTVDLAKFLVRLGHRAVVISNGGPLVKDLERGGVKHYQLPVHKKSLLSIIKLIPEVVKIIKKEEVDIVHARSRVPAGIAFFACRQTKKIFITTCHGYYRRHFLSRVMGWGKLVIAPSNVIARHMHDAFAVPYERLRLIPRSVDWEKFRFISPEHKKTDIFNIGIIGRITPLKGHLYFLRAMAKVSRVLPRIKIWIVGDAPFSKEAYKEEIRIMVRRLGLDHCTDFLGAQKDIASILANFNLLVFSSVVPEAFGRVIVEAQASGVPVVATRVGGVVDIIDDSITGILVPPADPESMAEAVIRVIKDMKLACFLAENAFRKVKEKFNLELMVNKTLEVYKEALSHFNILIIKLSSLGDVILSTAAIKAIRDKFKDNYKITLLIGEPSKEVFINCPDIDDLIVYDLKDKSIRAVSRLIRNLLKRNFEKVIDLQNNRFSHWLGFLSLAPERYGYDNKKFAFLLNHRIKNDVTDIDPLSHQFRLLKMLDIEFENQRLGLWPLPQHEIRIDEFLKQNWLGENQPLIGINISASKRWRTKAWPESKIIRLCEELALRNMRVVLTGTERDLNEAEELKNKVKNAKPIIACGKTTIGELVCLIKRCQLLVSADSAPLHIACAVDTPFVALFGPTDPSRHLAPNYKGIILNKHLDCSPCYKTKCKTLECMNMIGVEEVLAVIEKLLPKK